MIRYLQHKDIDKKKWDGCIDNSLNSLIYAKSWYLDIMCPGWDCIEIDNYNAVFPVPFKKKYNIRYVYPPFFIQQLGLFFAEKKYGNDESLLECINIIKNKFIYIEYNLNEKNTLSNFNITLKRKINYLLNLNQPYNTIFKNYSHGLKGKLRNKSREGILFSNNGDINDLIKLYKENIGLQLNKFKTEDFHKLKNLINTGIQKKCVEIRMAYIEGELIAGAVFLIYKNRITYLFSASSMKGKKKQAMAFILDNIINEYSNEPYIFDFEGSMVKSIAKFFENFGSIESVYLQLKINSLPRLIRWLKE